MQERVAVVTGAARGIGLATTKLLLADQLKVVMVDNDHDELHQAARDLNNVLAVSCDVSDPDQVDEMISTTITKIIVLHLGRFALSSQWLCIPKILSTPTTMPFRLVGMELRLKLHKLLFFCVQIRLVSLLGRCLAADGGFQSTGVGLPSLRT